MIAQMDAFSATTSDGIRLAARSYPGAGDAVVLLIPGLGTGQRVFEPFVPHLLPFSSVLTYDPRGIGESETSPPPWTVEQMASDAVAVANAAGHDVVSVFGASMGGVVAQQILLSFPDAVRRAVLAATTPGGQYRLSRSRLVSDRLAGRGTSNPGAAYRMACTVLYSPEFQRDHPEFIEEQVREREENPVGPLVFGAQRRATENFDALPRLGGVTKPTLVLHGTADLVTPIEGARALARAIPRAQHHWFDGAGHLFFHEQPQATAAAVQTFLLS